MFGCHGIAGEVLDADLDGHRVVSVKAQRAVGLEGDCFVVGGDGDRSTDLAEG